MIKASTPPKPKLPVITMSSLGENGRFGNQLFQYAFLKIYAKRYGLRVQTPEWIGASLFGHRDNPIRKKLPKAYENHIPDKEVLLTARKPLVTNVDFWGYFQFHTRYYAPYKEYFRYLYTPVPQVQERVEKGIKELRAIGKTLVGLHIRRGDYLLRQNHEVYGKLHFPAPCEWYKKWLEAIWGTLVKPVLFIASDEPDTVLSHFSEYKPIRSRELFTAYSEEDFYLDHYILSHCDRLAISNSTFSFTASMLNSTATVFVRPDLEAQRLVAYDPWNSPVNPWLHLIGF
ncbi:MAG: methyltransferase FkbM family [Paenibacillus sp.]|nr:methyltransferase FkbM family [Paenibacillus sp.]